MTEPSPDPWCIVSLYQLSVGMYRGFPLAHHTCYSHHKISAIRLINHDRASTGNIFGNLETSQKGFGKQTGLIVAMQSTQFKLLAPEGEKNTIQTIFSHVHCFT